MSRATRRSVRAEAPVAPAAPATTTEANPDSALIDLVEGWIARHREKEASTAYLRSKPLAEWTAEDRVLDKSSTAGATGYLEDLAEIASAEPTTPAGMVAQAKATLWHNLHPSGDDEVLAWKAASSVLRLCAEPLPEWAR